MALIDQIVGIRYGDTTMLTEEMIFLLLLGGWLQILLSKHTTSRDRELSGLLCLTFGTFELKSEEISAN